jgi:HEAT repeat protein
MKRIESLISGLCHEDAEARNRSALAIRDLGQAASPAVTALISALGDDDLSVRGAAVQALRAVGHPARDAVEPLLRVLAHDPCEFVRADAAEMPWKRSRRSRPGISG